MRNCISKHKIFPNILFLFTLSILFLTSNSFNTTFGVAQTHTDLEGVNIAIYNDNGILTSSEIALRHMFEWMNATVSNINVDEILNGNLNDCDILVYPGGYYTTYSASLGEEGREIVKRFIKNGGSYFGICGGAKLGINGLNLIDGSFRSTSPELPSGAYILEMNVNRNSTGPDLSDEPASYHTLYWNAEYYYSEDMSNINPIMTYQHNDQPGMIIFRCGSGTVFLSQPHAEYEENSDRDGTSDYDSYDDPDSEWDLFLKVSLWLYEASTTIPKDNWTPLLIAVSIIIPAIAGIGITVFVISRRRER
ncbi:MAG: BPL-N domain-containing protein [Candidatus Hodarchaeota archaeon]